MSPNHGHKNGLRRGSQPKEEEMKKTAHKNNNIKMREDLNTVKAVFCDRKDCNPFPIETLSKKTAT